MRINKFRGKTEKYQDLKKMNCCCYSVEINDESEGKRNLLGYVVRRLSKQVYNVIVEHHLEQENPLESYILFEAKDDALNSLKAPKNLYIVSLHTSNKN